jgi:molecular chaperone DnaK
VKILVLQGEHEQASKNDLLGEFILTGLRPAPAGEVEIEVNFDINSDGIVSVSARDLENGKEQAITVTATSGLSEDEVKRMMVENDEHQITTARDDALERKRGEARRNFVQVEKIFPQVRGLLAGSDFGEDAIRKAEGVLDRARRAIDGSDLEALETASEALSRTLNMFKGVVEQIG